MKDRYQHRASVRCIDRIDPWTRGRHRQSAPVLSIGCIASPCSRSPMALLATPMTLAHWKTSADGFGTASTATSSRGRATPSLLVFLPPRPCCPRRPPLSLPLPPLFPRPPPPPPPLPPYIEWPSWPALDPFFLFPESR